MTAFSETAATSWRAVSASRRGSAHACDVPNQDAVRCEQVGRPHGADVWVTAVADGHGGSRYVRSDVGARTAVDVAVATIRRALDADPDQDIAALLRAQVPHMVLAWREEVRAHAAAHPYTEAERARAGTDPQVGGGLVAYGATLLVALVGDEGVAVAQVGDGDALVRSHGFATRPVPGDERLVAGETTSLCLASAVDDFRYAFLPASTEPDLVLLATDGYGNSFAHADWWQGLLGDVASFVERRGVRELEKHLPDWLEESARVGGDDVSAVLVVRRPLAVEHPPAAAVVPSVREAPARPPTRELPPPDAERARPTRKWRTSAIALIALVVAVLSVVAALLLLAPDVPESPVDVPSDRSITIPPAGDDTSAETKKNDTGKGKGDGDGKGSGKSDTGRLQRQGDVSPSDPPTDTAPEEPTEPVRGTR